MIALAGHAADGFTWTLLKPCSLFRLTVHWWCTSKEEYRNAKKNIKDLVDIKKDSNRKDRKRGRDLESDNLF